MTKLPQAKPRELVKAIQKIGFQVKKQKGSHIDMRHEDGRRTIIPMHNKTIAKGTLKAILRQTGITNEELRKIL